MLLHTVTEVRDSSAVAKELPAAAKIHINCCYYLIANRAEAFARPKLTSVMMLAAPSQPEQQRASPTFL